MTVFQAAVGKPSVVDLPASAHGGESVGCRPASFFETIEGERSRRFGTDVGQLLDAEIFGSLFDDHGGESWDRFGELYGEFLARWTDDASAGSPRLKPTTTGSFSWQPTTIFYFHS